MADGPLSPDHPHRQIDRPILREQGLAITRRMYEIMFEDEHIRMMFNQSHDCLGALHEVLGQAAT